MHPVNLISAAICRQTNSKTPVELPCEPVDGLCAVTGLRGPCLPRSKVIPPSNCDQPLFKANHSNMVSVDVWNAWGFGETKEGKSRAFCPERQACWWCDGKEFRIVRKPEMRKIVLDGSPTTPWAMWITTSYKKHGSVRARVNRAGFGVIAFDERLVDTSKDWLVNQWWENLNAALAAGISRTVIETLDCPAHIMRECTLPVWMAFEHWARPVHQSSLYALLCYLLPSKEERDNADPS